MNQNSQDANTENLWIRLLFMILFMMIFGIAEFVLYLTAAIGFIFRVFKKTHHARVQSIGRDLAIYLKEIAEYLTFNSDIRPFPFSDWPQGHGAET